MRGIRSGLRLIPDDLDQVVHLAASSTAVVLAVVFERDMGQRTFPELPGGYGERSLEAGNGATR